MNLNFSDPTILTAVAVATLLFVGIGMDLARRESRSGDDSGEIPATYIVGWLLMVFGLLATWAGHAAEHPIFIYVAGLGLVVVGAISLCDRLTGKKPLWTCSHENVFDDVESLVIGGAFMLFVPTFMQHQAGAPAVAPTPAAHAAPSKASLPPAHHSAHTSGKVHTRAASTAKHSEPRHSSPK